MFRLLILFVFIVCSLGAQMITQYHMIVERSDYDAYIDVDSTIKYTQIGVWCVCVLFALAWMHLIFKYRNSKYSMKQGTIHLGKGVDKTIAIMYVFFVVVCGWVVTVVDEVSARENVDIDKSFWHTNLHMWIWGTVGFAILSILWQVHMITKHVVIVRNRELADKKT
jgi:hypothetical protein